MAYRNDQRLAQVMGSVSRGHCCVCRTLITFTSSDQLVYCINCRNNMNHRTCPRCTTSLLFPMHVQNVECGRCGFNTIFPPVNVQRRHQSREPSHRLLTCVSCRITISFPSDAPAVKCGNCNYVSVLRLPQQVVLVMNPDLQADDALVVAVELDPVQSPSQ